MIFISESILLHIKDAPNMGFFHILASTDNEKELFSLSDAIKIDRKCAKEHFGHKFFVVGVRKAKKAREFGAQMVPLASLLAKCRFQNPYTFYDNNLREIDTC